MERQLTSTHIRWIAEGCWYHYFNWRFHPSVKKPWLIALITFVVGLAVLFADVIDSLGEVAETSCMPSAVAFVALALVIIALAFFFKGMFVRDASKSHFIDYVVAHFENGGEALPDTNTVQQFIKGEVNNDMRST